MLSIIISLWIIIRVDLIIRTFDEMIDYIRFIWGIYGKVYWWWWE
jgi:hypothetical protein